jgi:hypothetical protein
MNKAQRNPNVQAPRRKRCLRLAPLLPELAIERLKIPRYTSIHVLKTFLISKSFPFVRDVESEGVAEDEVAGVEVVTMENTDKYALVRACPRIF